MLTGTAIETAAYQSLVRGNTIGEGITGARLQGGETAVFLPDQCHGCALVYGNSIADASDFGVRVEGNRNQVYGNDIEQAGQAGIYIERPGIFGPWHNVIGGDETSEENTISGSGGPAIEIVEASEYGNTRRNEVLRNKGSSNAGPFVALVGAANGGIEPPVLVSSTASGASGTAAAGATIRVFRKADSSPGEIEGFLAETVADEAGDWAVTYPISIQAGSIIAASQTTEEDGTSEFALATTTAPPGEEEKGGGNSPPPEENPPGPAPDRAAPETMIVKGPKPNSRSRTARFEFSASEPSSFRCKLDRRPISSCRSPRVYRHLKAGRHVFEVWAIDAAGSPDVRPAKWVFRVRGK